MEMRSVTGRVVLIFIFIVISCTSGPWTTQERTREIAGSFKPGDGALKVPLRTPLPLQDRAYLGLAKTGTFTLSDIVGEAILLEI
jgi:hypothetical protein